MNTEERIEQLMSMARSDAGLRAALLSTGNESEFCRVARNAGVELYDMDLITYGEESHAAMKRSTNGGGENTPMLDFEDDCFELLMTELRLMAKQ